MLDITRKATYTDGDGTGWDYYGDDDDPSTFYVLARPQFVAAGGQPSIQVTEYTSDGPDDGSGFVRLDVELGVPSEVSDAIEAAIPGAFPGAKAPLVLTTPDYQAGGSAYLTLGSATAATTYRAPASSFGSDVATFEMSLTATQLQTLVGALSTRGGALPVTYQVTVPARLPAVTATLSFDSSLAYAYQVTQPSYDSWGEETSPGSVKQVLEDSDSSKVTITWGTADPVADLRQAVADWANDTLADLVTAEVAKVLAVQGHQGNRSFKISEVSSFTTAYAEDMVVDWILAPTATLPSLASMGLDVADFTSTVDERLQQMTVSALVPFGTEALAAGSESGSGAVPAVSQLAVTVAYPGLDESEATFVFTDAASHTFAAPYSESAGPAWSLDYRVTFADPTIAAVEASVASMTTGAYAIDLPEIGHLRVAFDAQQAFATETTKPTSIEVTLTMGPDEQGEVTREVASVAAAADPQVAHVRIQRPVPLESTYAYQVTYLYEGGVTYTAPVVADQSGPRQVIPAAAATATTNVIVYVPAPQVADDAVFEADVRVWYDAPGTGGAGSIPGVGSLPTRQSPATFTVTPNPDATGNLFGRASFVGVAGESVPLAYAATIDTAQGQVAIPDSVVESDLPSIMVTPAQRYFTIEVDPSAIDWATSAYDAVEVLVDAAVAQGTAPSPPTDEPPQRSCRWYAGDTGSRWLTYPVVDGNVVTYGWKASYITAGQPVTSASGSSATDTVLEVPAGPSPGAGAPRAAARAS